MRILGIDPGLRLTGYGVIEFKTTNPLKPVLIDGGVIRLTVECIDAELSDFTGPWEARGRPIHDGDR